MVSSTEEIARRVDEADTTRQARRAEAATTVGDLARRHTALAAQLAELERQLGETVAAAGDVIDVDELARFTDVPASALTRWRDGAKPARGNRRRRSSTKSVESHPARRPADRDNRSPVSSPKPIAADS
ncbi:hypothetical protein L3Q67_02185 [Saccharothrix sp. AJ9571]|nr:hypothetical protein L3Q67_02185 [Saccharothrix sp. AJ9571]